MYIVWFSFCVAVPILSLPNILLVLVCDAIGIGNGVIKLIKYEVWSV